MTTEWEKQGQTKKLSKKERVKLCLLHRENKLWAMLVLEYYKAQLGMVIQDLSSICMGLIRPLFSICQRPQLETLTFGWWCTFLWNHGSHHTFELGWQIHPKIQTDLKVYKIFGPKKSSFDAGIYVIFWPKINK